MTGAAPPASPPPSSSCPARSCRDGFGVTEQSGLTRVHAIGNFPALIAIHFLNDLIELEFSEMLILFPLLRA